MPSNLSELEDVEHEKVSVSSIVNFVSEWRCFVFGGMLRDLRYYCGNKWVVPDKDTINSMVNAVGTTMRAYTLDVGVLESGETAVVEVHNFISCGLYGATVPLLMYTAAYDEEIARHKKGA